MKSVFPLLGGLLLASIFATTAMSQDEIDPNIAKAIEARQSHMHLNAFNLGLLGGMAKGEIEYDAAAAKAAAENLAALARMDESRYWPPGSDMETLGEEHTEALKAIWADDSEIGDRVETLVDNSAAMVKAAGNGLDSLRAAMGPLGKSCGGCHEDYRVAKE